VAVGSAGVAVVAGGCGVAVLVSGWTGHVGVGSPAVGGSGSVGPVVGPVVGAVAGGVVGVVCVAPSLGVGSGLAEGVGGLGAAGFVGVGLTAAGEGFAACRAGCRGVPPPTDRSAGVVCVVGNAQAP
jgi:hypothetical protein